MLILSLFDLVLENLNNKDRKSFLGYHKQCVSFSKLSFSFHILVESLCCRVLMAGSGVRDIGLQLETSKVGYHEL